MSETHDSPSGRVSIWADGDAWAIYVDAACIGRGRRGADECATACGVEAFRRAGTVVGDELAAARDHLAPPMTLNPAARIAQAIPCLLAEETAHPRYGRQTPLGTIVVTVNAGYE